MLGQITISTAVSILFVKAPLAIWLIIMCLRFVDRRSVTAGYRALLSLVGLLLCFSCTWSDFKSQNFPEAANSAMTAAMPSSTETAEAMTNSLPNLGGHGWLWGGASLIFAFHALLAIRGWIQLTPAAVHAAEVAQESTPSSKSKSSKRSKQTRPQHRSGVTHLSRPGLVEMLLSVAATCFLGYLTWEVIADAPFLSRNAFRASVLHLAATMAMLSISGFCALETTLMLSPDTNSAKDDRGKLLIRWTPVSWAAQILFLVKMILTTLVLLKLGDTESIPATTQALAAGFAIGLVILDFVAWMVPYRLRNFQRGTTPNGWASLALAAWLSVISYITISALPFEWPWQFFWS